MLLLSTEFEQSERTGRTSSTAFENAENAETLYHNMDPRTRTGTHGLRARAMGCIERILRKDFFKVNPPEWRDPVVMFDLDGVVRDFDTSWRKIWADYYGPPIIASPHSWDHIKQAAVAIGVDPDRARDLLFRTRGFDVMSKAPTYPGSILAIKQARANGWRIVIATDQRTPETRAGTIAWLKAWKVPYDCLTFLSNKSAVRADVYFEDKLENLLELAETYPKAHVFGVLRPWNITHEGRLKEAGVIPVFGTKEVSMGYRATWLTSW